MTYLAASDSGAPLMLPGGGFAFHADYAHEGADLVITGADGSKVVVVDYFAGSEPADLMTLDGHHLAGSLVDSLAGPIAPTQYAQAADTQTADVPAAVPEIGQVESIEGTITATGADGVKVDLAAGSSVFQGDVLETSSDGAVNIVFMDGTTFSLGADAKMVLDELIYDASSNTGSSIMSVVTGTFVFITGQVAKIGPDAMKVNTPSGTIGIRGTKVACNLEVADGQSICVLLPEEDGTVGEFIFTNESGSQGVSNAYEAIIANAFNASLIVTQVLPDQLGSLFEGLLPGVLETEAPPVVLGQGGTFFDFLFGQGNASFGLQTSGVLDDQEGLALLTGGTVPEQDPQSLAVAASLFLAEPAADGPGTLSTGNISLVLAQSITLTGFSVTANGSPVTLTSGGVTVVLTQDGNTVDGLAGGALIFRFTLNPETGDVTVFLAQPLDHLDTSATGTSDTIEFSFEVEIFFIDGTSQTVLVQANVLDAGPTATTTSNTVDEATDIDAPATGNLAIVAGNDGLDSVELTGVTATDGGGIIPLSSGGAAITLKSLGGGTFKGVTSGGTVVFEITFDAATGDYSFTLLAPLDQPSSGADSITLTFDVVVTDGDGDSVISTIVIAVTDDVVVAVDDDGGTVSEGGALPLQGVLDNDESGVDGFGGITQFVHNGIVYFPDADGEITIETALGGSFTFNFNTGKYEYTAPDSVDNSSGNPTETFVYTVADGDGDTDTATLTIAVSDAHVPSASETTDTVDEAALPDGSTPSSTAESTSGTLIFSSGEDAPTMVILMNGFAVNTTGTTSIDGTYGTLVIDAEGNYTYTLNGNTTDHSVTDQTGSNDTVDDTFSFTVQDRDGSTATNTLKITVQDDGPLASPDDGGTVGAGTTVPLAGNVLANDDPGADGFGGVTQFTHNGKTYDPTTSDATADVISNDGDTIVIVTKEGGEFTFDFNTGDYSYTAPSLGIGGDTTESFDYVFEDGDGDRAGSTLTVNLLRPIFAGALLETNTNQEIQTLRVILTRNDADIFEPTEESLRTGTGQQSLIEFSSGGVEFESGNSYSIILKFEGGSGNTNVTEFDLIFDTTAEPLDAESNIFLTLLGEGNIQLGDQGQSHDGVIWTLEDDGSGFVVTSPAILYDVDDIEIIEVDATTGVVTATAGEVLILDSDGPNESFALNFGLLPTIHNVSPTDDSIFLDIGALNGGIEAIDISGSNAEVNTLTLTAQDVIDVTDGNDRLIVLGDDNDILVLSDPGNWVDFIPETDEIDPDGSTTTINGETFDLYVAISGAELLVDDDLTVLTAMA